MKMLLFIAFALHTIYAEFSEDFLNDHVDDEPNMAEFEIFFNGEGCVKPTSQQVEKTLREVFTKGVEVSNQDSDNAEDVDINIDDLDKIDQIPDMFPGCEVEVGEVEKVYSELLPTPNEMWEELSDILEEVDDEEIARRNLQSVPRELSFLKNIGRARAQRSGTCAAFTAASVMEVHENRDWSKPTSVRLSPLSVYAYRIPKEGMYPGNVFKIIRDKGVSMEADWTFDDKPLKFIENLDKDDVPAAVRKGALRHRIVKLEKYTGSNAATIKNLFVKYGAAMMATKVYAKFNSAGRAERVDCDMWVQKPGYKVYGGHAMTALAYNSKGILIRNSWGPDWCDKGNVMLPWNEVKMINGLYFWQDAPTTDCAHFETDTGSKCTKPKKGRCAKFPCQASDGPTCCENYPKTDVCEKDIPLGRTISVTSYKLNGKCVKQIDVYEGERVTFDVNFHNAETSCTGCIEQIYAGIKGKSLDCLYNGNPRSNMDVRKKLTFDKLAVGKHTVVGASAWGWRCGARNTGTTIATINVLAKAQPKPQVCEKDISLGRTISVTSYKVNGQCVKEIDINYGQKVTFDVNFHNAETSCKGCIEQIYAGISGQKLQCLYNGNPRSSQDVRKRLEFPKLAIGTHKIVGASDWGWRCGTKTSGTTIATINVLDPNVCETDISLGRTISVTSYKVNGKCVKEIDVTYGQTVTVDVNFHNAETSCKGCIEQIYGGIQGQKLQCLYNGNPRGHQNVRKKLTFSNLKVGTHKVVGASDWGWRCGTKTSGTTIVTINVLPRAEEYVSDAMDENDRLRETNTALQKLLNMID